MKESSIIILFQLFWHCHISQEAWESKLEIAYFLTLLSENSHSDMKVTEAVEGSFDILSDELMVS